MEEGNRNEMEKDKNSNRERINKTKKLGRVRK
jgi:hypothetical protein